MAIAPPTTVRDEPHSPSREPVPEFVTPAIVETVAVIEVLNPDSASEPEPSAIDPVGQSRRALIIIAVLALVYTIYWARAILLPLTIAVLLAFTLRPMVRRLRRWKIPEPVGAAGLLFALMIFAIGATGSVISPLTRLLNDAPVHLAEVRLKLLPLEQGWAKLSKTSEQVQEFAKEQADTAPIAVSIQQSKLSTNLAVVSGTMDWLGSVFVVLVLSFFLLNSGDRLLNQVLTTLPSFRDKRRTVELVYEVEAGINRYLVTVTCINLGLGVVTGLTMWLIGLPNPVMWGAMATLFNFIPYLGALAGAAVLAVASILAFDSLSYAMLAPMAFVAFTSVEGYLITPTVLGRSISLNPIVIFVSLMFWGWLWGFGGAILAVPLVAVTKLATEAFDSTKHIAKILSA